MYKIFFANQNLIKVYKNMNSKIRKYASHIFLLLICNLNDTTSKFKFRLMIGYLNIKQVLSNWILKIQFLPLF